MTEDSSRFVYLDNIRNNLVYSVVFLHAALIFGYPMTFWWPAVDKAASSRIYETFLLVCDAFQMPILIFIAVLFIFPSLKNTTVPGYLKKRFLRLMVPVLTFSVCGADIGYPLRYEKAGLAVPPYIDTFFGFWKGLFTDPILVFRSGLPFFNPNFNVGHTWFMSFLFAATLVIVFFSRLKKGKATGTVSVESTGRIVFKTGMIFLAFTLVYLAGIIALAVNEIDVGDWLRLGGFLYLRLDQGMQLVLMIIFGLYVYKKQWLTKGDIGGWRFWGVTSLLFLTPYVLLLYAGYIPFINEFLIVTDHNLFNNDHQPMPAVTETFKLFFLIRFTLVLWVCLSLLMFFISLSKRFFNQPNMITSFCSKHSIYVYVLHLVPVIILQYALRDIAMPSLLKVALITVIAICACLWLSHRLVYPCPKAAIAFFVGLKAVALIAGFTFYYYALLLLTFIAFTGALEEGARYFFKAKNKKLSMREVY